MKSYINGKYIDDFIPTEYTFNQVKRYVEKLTGYYVKFVTFEDREEITTRVDTVEVFDVDDCKIVERLTIFW